MTKREKEAEQRRLAHLEAMRQQGIRKFYRKLVCKHTSLDCDYENAGISVPEKRAGATDDQGKKKVMYGVRQRSNKKKQDETSISSQSAEAMETQESSSPSKQPEAELEVHEICSGVHSIALCPSIRRMSLIIGMRRKEQGQRRRRRREDMSRPTGMMKVREKRRAPLPSKPNQLNNSSQWRQVIARVR